MPSTATQSAPGPIFVVGMNGSGTTVLLDHLNSHSLIFGFSDETRILPHFIQDFRRRGNPRDKESVRNVWTRLCTAFPFWAANGETAVSIPDDFYDRARTPAAVFDYILTYFAKQSGKRIWCEKTPMHALHIADLAVEFPTARFLHIIRDGRDCAASFKRRWQYDPFTTIYRWKTTIRAARQQARLLAPNRYLEVRYESLTADPEVVLRSVCDFLEVDYEPSLLTSCRPGERMRSIPSKRLVTNTNAYTTYFSEEAIEKLESIAGQLLRELGYKTRYATGDDDLSSLYIWLHQTITHIGRIRDILVRARGSRSPLTLVLGRLRSGLMYRRRDRY